MAVNRGLVLQQQSSPPVTDTKPIEEGRHGHLVAQILETQKDLEDDSHHQSQSSQRKKVEIVSPAAHMCDNICLVGKMVFVGLYASMFIYLQLIAYKHNYFVMYMLYQKLFEIEPVELTEVKIFCITYFTEPYFLEIW